MLKIATLFSSAVLLFSCSTNTHSNGTTTATADTSILPVETRSPNSNYTPAFAGQTRIAGVKTSTAFESKAIAITLSSPWGITCLPDGRLLITEKAGNMRIAT